MCSCTGLGQKLWQDQQVNRVPDTTFSLTARREYSDLAVFCCKPEPVRADVTNSAGDHSSRQQPQHECTSSIQTDKPISCSPSHTCPATHASHQPFLCFDTGFQARYTLQTERPRRPCLLAEGDLSVSLLSVRS